MFSDELDDDFTIDTDELGFFASEGEVQTSRNLRKPIRKEIAGRKREYINGLKKQALTDLVASLPPEDTDLYILSNGSGSTYRLGGQALAFEFGHFIPVLAGMMNITGGWMYLSTWTMNRAHSLNILEFIDNGTYGHVAVMTDPYFLRRESAVANNLVEGILRRKQRFIAFKNHVKCLCMATADETQTVVVTGSANLSSQPRAENFILSTNRELYQWMKTEFFEAMFNGDE